MRLEQLLRAHARSSAPAVDGVGYAELDARADALARELAALGVRRGDRVAFWLDKSPYAVAVMQAVLRLGAAYVPVDPVAPAGRAAAVIRDCAPRVVVSDRAGELRAEGITATTPAGRPGGPLPAHDGTEDDLAYILYTSGSTGAPKGVCISHRNAMAFVEWAAGELGARPDDRFANHAPFHFDLSVLDLYVAFHAGASVQLIPREAAYAPRLLVEFLVQRGITVWYSVPSALVLMARDGGLLDVRPPALRALLFAGEPYPVTHLRRLREHLPGIRFLNLYGPTETNVCAFYEVTDLPAEPVPIGTACSGDRIHAVREDGSAAAPGEEGELVVEGPTVMLGYWGRPPQTGPYPTGDRVVLRDGVYHYLGRRDGMVKVRGHRIELGDVESALLTCPGVSEVAVVVSGAGLDARLVAYVVPGEDRRPNLLELKRHCADRLPRYMIVDSVRYVAALPRTGNGKTDRRRLTVEAAP
ncbi:amino acid adenylation domain-containing protein [Actinoallomurus soli]|uniref:amino acid adenylation domain-containing protein n=1 Tax=Actinoallomurus soli TaxID=2952535 RepID=UPI002092D250|nr:amino acid adenylation domain-containing protein [Actinoallomurus soli]MCO5967367.1 amino acid adenylation domain-containing protein [Actinoallomurus soli]